VANKIHDDQHDDVRREIFSEKRYNRFERESRHRSPSESSDLSTAHGVIDEEFKKKYLRCLAYMKLIERLYDNHPESDDDLDITQQRISRRVSSYSCFDIFLLFVAIHNKIFLYGIIGANHSRSP
jgi:hypothetical protein